MAYSRVTRTAFGRDALEYAAGHGTGHNQNEQRNVYVGYVNLLPGIDPADQMEVYWNRARKNHKTQVLRIVQSFSTKELNPQDENDILTANLIGQEFAQKYYPDRQAVVFTQIDGKSGLVHNHVIVSDTDMISSKGCEKEQYHFPKVKEWTNAVAGQYFELDSGVQQVEDKTTQTERHKREIGEYVWKDDLKERITSAMASAESEQEWMQNLVRTGVNIEVHDSKKRGRYYTYELVDTSQFPAGKKVPQNLKSRSYKLGTLYDSDHVQEFFKEKEAELELERKRHGSRADADASSSVTEKSKPQASGFEKASQESDTAAAAAAVQMQRKREKEEEKQRLKEEVRKKMEARHAREQAEREEALRRKEEQRRREEEQIENRKPSQTIPSVRTIRGEDGSIRIEGVGKRKAQFHNPDGSVDLTMELQLKADEERRRRNAKREKDIGILQTDGCRLLDEVRDINQLRSRTGKKGKKGSSRRQITGREVADRIDRSVQWQERKKNDRGFGE
ncbi:relaxase/mobilization nuclease domain-containing protein [Sellimonas catena]|uniref:MobA/VirD2-like nuclease domain-containing protein n=1 Tax=Sellimonas catena TaxID=2994035 RepID=A0A9W6CDI5_9FIRM|nr:relaxase/mobilization nuclease domain-containing protein [Sellimonas catena]GLG05881.1 hypothetical protein Selli1_30550 [Sellimonas catena]